MKFLWIMPQPFYTERGTPMSSRHLLEAVAARGHEVDLVTYPMGRDFQRPPTVRLYRSARVPFVRSVPIGPSLRKLPLDVALFLRTIRLVRAEGAERYDAIQGVEEGAWIAAAVAAVFRLPFICDMDSNMGQQARDSRNPLFRWFAPVVEAIDGWIIRRSIAVVTVCGTLSDDVRRVAPEKPIHQIEDMPNAFPPKGDPTAAQRVRQRFDLPEGDLIVYTGNLEPYQGVDLLLAAAPHALAENSNAVFLVAGGEPEQVAALQRMVPAKWRSRIVLAGHQPEDEMGDFLAAADILVSPRSHGTNTPLKVYTYLMASRALVVTDRPVHTQILSSSEAVLAEPTPEGLAAGLVSLVGRPDRREELARSARRLGERFSPEAFQEKADRFLDGVAALLARPEHGSPEPA